MLQSCVSFTELEMRDVFFPAASPHHHKGQHGRLIEQVEECAAYTEGHEPPTPPHYLGVLSLGGDRCRWLPALLETFHKIFYLPNVDWSSTSPHHSFPSLLPVCVFVCVRAPPQAIENSSENFWSWQHSELNLKSGLYRANSNSDTAITESVPVVLCSTSDRALCRSARCNCL